MAIFTYIRKVFKRDFWTRKRLIWGVIIIAIILIVDSNVLGGSGAPANIQTTTVKRQHIEQTVLSTGEVVSSVDLSLSFQASGVVRQVLVKESQKVRAGQTLATLDQASARAALTSAQGTLAQAQANYTKVLDGASNEDVQVSKAAVDAAKTTLQYAYTTLLNSCLDAISVPENSSDGTIAVTGFYNGSATGEYRVVVEGSNFRILNRDLEEGPTQESKTITRGDPIAIGTHGLFITFSSTGSFNGLDRWIIAIPNTQASTYLTNLNAYEAAKKSLEQAEAALALKQAAARPADLQAAQAQVLSAQGQVAAAQATLNNTSTQAPSDGTITKVDIKIGEQAVASQEVIILQDVGDLYAEANVSEADIAAIQVGQPVEYTFDALGPDKHFQGTVQTVNPASTVISGIVNYKVTASIDDGAEIKPGMTANMTVLVAAKDNALAVPSNAILNKNGKKYIRVIDDPKTKAYSEVEVTTGLNADGGLVEILNGLQEGQEVVISI